MATLSDFDFSDCRYDPRKKTFPTVISQDIPEFSKYEGEARRNVFAYIVCMYDKKSPLWSKENEYFKRKMLAAEVCSLPKGQSGGWHTTTKEILEGQSKEVNALAVSYLANLGDTDYMMLINEMVMFHGYTMDVLNNKYDDKTYKTMQLLADGIRDRTRKIFGSGEYDELTRVRILLYESVEKDRQRLNPEAIVQMIDREGDVPKDWNRYGKDYEVDELKYMSDEHTQG